MIACTIILLSVLCLMHLDVVYVDCFVSTHLSQGVKFIYEEKDSITCRDRVMIKKNGS
jgi:hypothetical protein